ncbi:JAB domain-containing protein [Pseudomonas sp. RW10S2]|uniref:JAB domain-containing protein n=1 Tax=Pseudomonas sp. RW10S2 TaxID=459637 RepID=UPI0016474024|nr:JAB domain-containing protein [Pseudomonas sp. RW10S2]MBC3466686.1 DNA repair protein RadC [Pseudomonas sp. RW10S2]
MTPFYSGTDCAICVLSQPEQRLVRRAVAVLEKRLFQRGQMMSSPDEVKRYLQLRLAQEKHEVFAVMFLSSQHRLITFETLVEGTINSATVPPRRVLQRALEVNSAAVILAHHHPSGNVQPSSADAVLTRTLKELLAQVDVRVLDHFVVGCGEAYSFAEAGKL